MPRETPRAQALLSLTFTDMKETETEGQVQG